MGAFEIQETFILKRENILSLLETVQLTEVILMHNGPVSVSLQRWCHHHHHRVEKEDNWWNF